MSSNTNYGAAHITKLEGLEAVRLRPAMYIGDTGQYGLHHLFRELVDNSIDEVVAGYADKIWVVLHKDGSLSVKDNGRGIPVEMHEKYGVSTLELVLCHLHAGGKFESKLYPTSSGLHGVGAKCVVALSTKTVARITRDGKVWEQTYACGKPSSKVAEVGSDDQSGTFVRFWPDPSIFSDSIKFDKKIIQDRCEELAYLNPGKVTVELTDEATGESEKWFSKKGLLDMMAKTAGKREILGQPFHFIGNVSDIVIDLVMCYFGKSDDNFTRGFVNNVYTPNGGTHVRGAQLALIDAVTTLVASDQRLKHVDGGVIERDVLEGLALLVAVKVKNPEFEGQTKGKLGNREVRDIVRKVAADGIADRFDKDVALRDGIKEKVVTAILAREAARKAREQIKRGAGQDRVALPGKLADCASDDPRINEIWIVEGDSAGGSAQNGRDRNIQAVLKLRGKIMNVEKGDIHKLLDSEQVRNIIDAVGLQVSKNGSETTLTPVLRYGKIIICTDADVDGSHIACLLLTFFYRYCPSIIDDGKLYLACPPLYKVTKGKNRQYACDEDELKAIVGSSKNASVVRFKGLGEMNADELGDTTMDVRNRKLVRVTITDAVKASEMIEVLLGSDTKARKAFIEANANMSKIQV